MKRPLPTRRRAISLLAGWALAGISGCGVVGPAVQVILKLQWDKITTVLVNILTGYATIRGMLDGKEVQDKKRLTDEELKAIKEGATVRVELKDGKEQTVKPGVD